MPKTTWVAGAPMPPKYLDRAGTQVNPDWMEWAKEETWHAVIACGYPLSTYFPEDSDKAIPPDGGWIRIVEVPHTALAFDVPLMSMWHARPHQVNSGALRIGRNQVSPFRPQQAVIATPGGDLHLWPHEYVLVDDITAYVGMEPDVLMHDLGGTPPMAAHEDAMFYLMSRGITRHDAALMLLDRIDLFDFCYFTFSPEIVRMFGSVGRPLWRAIAIEGG